MYISNLFGHIKTVIKHKYYVFIAMKDCGRPLRGLLHDISKFSLSEFSESVKYYQQGKRSPIEAAKEDKGYSDAWFHHKGRNKHHSQYWVDISFGEIKPCKIPYEILIEHICDTIGAGKAYMGNKWTNSAPIDYYNRIDHKSIYHPETRKFVEYVYNRINSHGWNLVSHELKLDKYKSAYDNNLFSNGKVLYQWQD